MTQQLDLFDLAAPHHLPDVLRLWRIQAGRMTFTRRPVLAAILPADIGVKHRCATDRHPGATYNPLFDVTWCLCGRITRPGKCAEELSDREKCETFQGRKEHDSICPIHRKGAA